MLAIQQLTGDPFELASQAMLKARMNCIYYEREIARVQKWDRWLRFLAALLASGGVAIAVKWFADATWLPVVAGVVSACLSAASLVFALPERAKAAAALLPQYLDVFHRLRTIVRDADNIDQDVLHAALKSLDDIAVVEAKEIRTNDRKLLAEARKLVLEEAGLPEAG
jgi:hypothetical protein